MTEAATPFADDPRRPRAERLMKLREVAEDPRWPWATSDAQLRRLCARGELRFHRIGKANWLAPEDLDAYQAAQVIAPISA